jgi:hypothetical protein
MDSLVYPKKIIVLKVFMTNITQTTLFTSSASRFDFVGIITESIASGVVISLGVTWGV